MPCFNNNNNKKKDDASYIINGDKIPDQQGGLPKSRK